jgi:uncharacterized Tic20 family protein
METRSSDGLKRDDFNGAGDLHVYNPISPVSSSSSLQPSSNERLMALLAHLSILLPQLGWAVPLILWLVNKDTAPFAAYQSKQSFFFQLAVAVSFWILAVCGVVFGLLTLGFGFLAVLPLLGLWHTLASIYGIIGAVISYQGRDFRYFLIGSIVEPD